MSTRRPVTVAAVAAAALVATASPASAHAGFDVRQLPVDSTEIVELRVPIEIDSTNETVDVLVPSGWTVDECGGATGWTCDTVDRGSGETVVNLARAGEDAGTVELFTLTMTAPDQEGTYSFPVVQGYADGTEAAWIGEQGGDRPSPRIQVGDDTTPVERSTELPTHDESTPAASAPSATPSPPASTRAPIASTPPEPTPTPPEPAPTDPGATPELIAEQVDDEQDGEGGLSPWLIGAIAAAAAAAAAVALVARRD